MEKKRNLWVIPTDKPSRLHYYNHIDPLGLSKEYFKWKQGRNIYITSEEEIKEGDWTIYLGNLVKVASLEGKTFAKEYCKKIILTTDQDLIKDGVQAIDDEFLEWFMKNPSCEEVEIKPLLSNNGRALFGYKIIIPKEEPCDNCNNEVCCCIIRKQETLEEITEQIQKDCHKFVDSIISKVTYQDATNTFLFMKLAELTLKLKNYETRS